MVSVFQSLFTFCEQASSPKRCGLHDATAPRQSQIAAALLFDLTTVDIR
jgi:hypothetical protein